MVKPARSRGTQIAGKKEDIGSVRNLKVTLVLVIGMYR